MAIKIGDVVQGKATGEFGVVNDIGPDYIEVAREPGTGYLRFPKKEIDEHVHLSKLSKIDKGDPDIDQAFPMQSKVREIATGKTGRVENVGDHSVLVDWDNLPTMEDFWPADARKRLELITDEKVKPKV